MKNLICALLLALGTQLQSYAIGGYYVLNYQFNYDRMTIDGQPAKHYVSSYVYNDMGDATAAFDKFKAEVEPAFLRAANKDGLENHGYTMDNKEESRYEIVISILDVDEDGEHKVEAAIRDKKYNGIVMSTIKAKAGSGRFNSFLRLFLEQLAKSGERLGDKLADEMDELRN